MVPLVLSTPVRPVRPPTPPDPVPSGATAGEALSQRCPERPGGRRGLGESGRPVAKQRGRAASPRSPVTGVGEVRRREEGDGTPTHRVPLWRWRCFPDPTRWRGGESGRGAGFAGGQRRLCCGGVPTDPVGCLGRDGTGLCPARCGGDTMGVRGDQHWLVWGCRGRGTGGHLCPMSVPPGRELAEGQGCGSGDAEPQQTCVVCERCGTVGTGWAVLSCSCEPSRTVLGWAGLGQVVLCCVGLWCSEPCCAAQGLVVPYQAVPCHATLCHSLCAVPLCVVPAHAVLVGASRLFKSEVLSQAA